MAQKHDLLDDIIDIQRNWDELSHPLNNIADSLTLDPEKVKVFDPADYKVRPRANSIYCVNCTSRKPDACRKCLDVCPVDAIKIHGQSVKVLDNCRKCGLCATVCPTEVFSCSSQQPLSIYNTIAGKANKFEKCYVTCTRALKRLPRENEVLLPCVGAIAPETWFALLCEYPNIEVYLPLGICDRCRTVTGELAYSDAIAAAEEWSGETVGLEVNQRSMNHEESRAYKRSQFVSNVTTSTTRLVTRGNPALAGAQAVAQRLQQHSQQITKLQRALEKSAGAQNSQSRRHILTQRRKLVLSALQKYPDLASGMTVRIPKWDSTRCTMCGDCVKACPVHANDMDSAGHFSFEPAYCVGCDACAKACPEGAITMVERDAADLVIPDEDAIRRQHEREEQKKKAAELAEKGKKALEKGLDALEKLDDSDDGKASKSAKSGKEGSKPASAAKSADSEKTSAKATQSNKVSGSKK